MNTAVTIGALDIDGSRFHQQARRGNWRDMSVTAGRLEPSPAEWSELTERVLRRPTAAGVQQLAAAEPEALLQIVQGQQVSPGFLTHAAEALKGVPASQQTAAVVALLDLLQHESSLVREGALYGLARWRDEPQIRDRISRAAGEDESPAVREAAEDVLE
jgi:hypothetical protein